MASSSIKTWTASSGNVTRVASDGSPKEGCGNNKRLYVGRISGYDYRSWLKFTNDWSGVGKIVRAVLIMYTDNGLGRLSVASSSDTPKLKVRRVTAAFGEGSTPNDDEDFGTSDYKPGSTTATGEVLHSPTKEADGLVRIDITKLVDLWAPSGVKRSNGSTGTPVSNHGLALLPTSTDGKYAWAGWSEDATGDAINLKPVIELTYELGATAPDAPTNLEPSGSVVSIGAFEGDFYDTRPTDQLRKSRVQVYSPAKSATIEADDNVVTCSSAHGFANGAKVYITAMTGGTGLSTFTEYFVRDKTATTFKLAATSGGAAIDVTLDATGVAIRTLIYDRTQSESNAAIVAGRFNHVPSNLAVVRNTNYAWRCTVTDQEGRTSAWTSLTTFSVSNTNPTAPTITPSAKSYATLDGVQFKTGTFADPDAGDKLFAFQYQLSAYSAGAPEWDDAEFILWDTGKRGVPVGATTTSVPYGGASLDAGTYYWRARVWDNKGGVSGWTTTSITLTADFEADPGEVPNAIQLRPRAPWRILIKEMKFNTVGTSATGNATTHVITTATAHGLRVGRQVRFSALTGGTGLVKATTYYVKTVPSPTTLTLAETHGGATIDFSTNITAATLTAVTTRGPGNVVAVLEDAYNVGASLLYNSPGEAHFTLGIAHPQIAVIEPRQTHYAIEFRQGDGWREVFAGLMMDFDASDTDVVFYGTDYLGLLDFTIDEHYDPANIEKSSDNGGSKYVNKTITQIVTDQLKRAREPLNSPVGFISTGSIATMGEQVTVYSTYQQTLPFVTSLLDSHKAGTGKKTRLHVRKTTSGGYEFVVTDDPGVVRDNLRLRYGELVQGYRVVPFGGQWGTRVSAIGRDKNGVKVRYATVVATGIDENVWGRWNVPQFIDGVADANDMTRRTKQAVTSLSRLGKQVALGLRSGVLQPRDGYDLLDIFPVDIEHGSVSTDAFGSGYWVAVGITWQALQRGDLNTTLTLHPREDSVAPDDDLLTLQELSPADGEWQIGSGDPAAAPSAPTALVPSTAATRYYFNNITGTTYKRVSGASLLTSITGTI